MSRYDRASGGESSWRFGLGCALIFLVFLVLAALLPARVGQLAREKAAVQTVRELGGSDIDGIETFATGWFQWLIPARIVSVNLAGTRATNADLAGLRYLTRLERLDLERTAITGGGLEPLSGLTRLQVLSLEATAIGDDDLRRIAGLTKLISLKLGGTQVSDTGLDSLDAMEGLAALNVAGTKVTDAGFARLRAFKRLQRLYVDENQVTPTSVAHFQALTGLKQISVYVPRGTGRRAKDLLASVGGVEVSGFRRAPEVVAARSVPPGERRLWDGGTPWEATTGGVVEAILAKAPLQPEQLDRLLDVLGEARPAGDWRKTLSAGIGSRLASAVPKREPIRNDEEFLQVVAKQEQDWEDRYRTFVYARSGNGRAAVPRLLEFLKSPDEELRRRAVTVLIRIDLSDPQVVSVIRGMLRAYDMHERARTVYALRMMDVRWTYGDVIPEIDAAGAKVAVSLLLEMPEDEYCEVRSGIAGALASIVKKHPQEAERAVPFLQKALNDSEFGVRVAGAYALGAIAEAPPGRANEIVPWLLDMLQNEPGEARWEILHALQNVAPQNAETANAAVPVLLGLIRDKNLASVLRWAGPASLPTPSPITPGEDQREQSAVPGALGRIVEYHPEHVKQIVPAALRMMDEADPWIKWTASFTLRSVAAGVCAGNAQLRGVQR